MSKETYFKDKEEMINAVKSAKMVYMLTQEGDNEPELVHRFNMESMSETIAFIVANFSHAADLLVDTDQAVVIASDGATSVFPADLIRNIQVLMSKMKMYIYKDDADDDE